MLKSLKLAVSAVTLGAAIQANALVVNFTNDGDPTLTDDPFSVVGVLSPVNAFGWLDGERMSWNNKFLTPTLPDPTLGLSSWTGLNGVAPTIDVVAGDYIFLHYGAGNATSLGGGVVALYFTTDQTYTPPVTGSGPNGQGSIGNVYLWDHVNNPRLPDGGFTVMLIGSVLTGLGLLRRKLAR